MELRLGHLLNFWSCIGVLRLLLIPLVSRLSCFLSQHSPLKERICFQFVLGILMRRTNTLDRKKKMEKLRQSALFAGIAKKTSNYRRVNERSFFV